MSLASATFCPACKADLRGEPIPLEHLHMYGGRSYYSRAIGVEYDYTHPERYDGISEWLCPDCGYREGRWTGRALGDGECEGRFGRAVATDERQAA